MTGLLSFLICARSGHESHLSLALLLSPSLVNCLSGPPCCNWRGVVTTESPPPGVESPWELAEALISSPLPFSLALASSCRNRLFLAHAFCSLWRAPTEVLGEEGMPRDGEDPCNSPSFNYEGTEADLPLSPQSRVWAGDSPIPADLEGPCLTLDTNTQEP